MLAPPHAKTRPPQRTRSLTSLDLELPSEMLRVLLRKMRPFLRHIVLREDRRNRACRDARAAVDALNGVDKQLIGRPVIGLVLFGVDAIYRTRIYASGVLRADTGFCDYIGHF